MWLMVSQLVGVASAAARRLVQRLTPELAAARRLVERLASEVRESWRRVQSLTCEVTLYQKRENHSAVLKRLSRLYRKTPDAFQDVIVKLLQAERLELVYHESYLAVAVRNQESNNARFSRRCVQLPDEFDTPWHPESASDRVAAKQVVRLLDASEPRYAEALRLRLAGFNAKEIAEEMDEEHATIRKWFGRNIPTLIASRTGLVVDLRFTRL
jgi:hypothetical protein